MREFTCCYLKPRRKCFQHVFSSSVRTNNFSFYLSCLSSSSSSSSSRDDRKESLDSLAIHPYRSSLLTGSLDSIPCLLRADVSHILLVNQHWCAHKRTFLASPAVPSSFFSSFLVVSDRATAVLMDIASKICSKQQAPSLYSSHLIFSPSFSLLCKWWNHTVVPTQLQFGRILFLQRDQLSICSITSQ